MDVQHRMSFYVPPLVLFVTFAILTAIILLTSASTVSAQDVTVEFEDFFTDIALFSNFTELPGPLLVGGSTIGVGSSGGIGLAGKHALTYDEQGFDIANDGDKATVSTFFKTGDLSAPPVGSQDILGQVFISSESNGHPFQTFGSNTFFASVIRDSTGISIGSSGKLASGAFYPRIETAVTLQSNRWYELSASFTNDQQTSVDIAFTVTDYGSTGQVLQGVAGTITSGLSGLTTQLSDPTWFGGFAAEPDDRVDVDHFTLEFPGGSVPPTQLSIEPTFDAQLRPTNPFPLGDGSTTLTIDGGSGVSFPILKVLAEFDLSGIPANAQLISASLIVQPLTSSSLNIRAMGYEGDGLASLSDPGALLRFMGQSTGNLSGGVENLFSLDENYIESLLGSVSHLGLRLESPIAGPFVNIVASEAATGTPPTLVVEYVLPNSNGDFDADGDTDGADFLAWQRGESFIPFSASDLADWEANYGSTTSPLATATTVPEPTSLSLIVFVAISLAARRIKL